jgi:hypothetical protein
LHQRQRPGLGRAVSGGAWRGAQRTDAADEDDATALRLCLHQPVGVLGDVERRDEIQTDDAFMKPRRGRGRVASRAAAGVVDDHVETPEVALDGVEQSLQGVVVTHIGGNEGCALCAQRRRLFRLASGTDDHPCVRGQEPQRDTGADALGTTGYQHHLAAVIKTRMQLHHVLLFY